MFAIKIFGTFGACWVYDTMTAGRDKTKVVCFNSESEANAFRDMYWPLSEVAAQVDSFNS